MHAKICRVFRFLHFTASVVSLALVAEARTTLQPMTWEEGCNGATYQIAVNSDADWTATTDVSWLRLSASTQAGEGVVTVKVVPNGTGADRSATIVVDRQIHTLTQHAEISEAHSIGAVRLRGDLASDAMGSANMDAVAPAPTVESPPAVAALLSSGNVFRADRSFSTRLETASGFVRAVAATPDGGFVVVGRFSTIAGQPHLDVAKYKADSTVDPAFNPNIGFDNEVDAAVVQPDGKIIVAGTFTTFNGTARSGIARLNADGALDLNFDPGVGFDNAVQSIAIQADGKIVAGGDFTSFNGTSSKGLVRLNGNGSLDSTFSVGTGFSNGADNRPVVRAVAVQADGKIVVGGSFSVFNGVPCQDIVRLSPFGALELSFLALGNPEANPNTDGVYALLVQPDGRIVVGGIFTIFNGAAHIGVTRLNPNGASDATFDPGFGPDSSQVLSLALQADGRIVVGGNFTNFNGTASGSIIRLNPSGTADVSFNSGSGFRRTEGDASISSLTILMDGRIAAGGEFTSLNNRATVDVARLTSTGAPDTLATEPFRGPAATVAATAIGGGKIIVAGFLGVANGVRRTGIARINGDGSLDPTFGVFGSGFDADIISRFAVQPDGRIVVIGGFSSYNGVARNGIARLNADGSLDSTFALSGSGFNTDIFFTIALQTDGKVIVTGDFSQYNGTPRGGIARLNTDGSLDTTFNPGSGFDGVVRTLRLQDDGKVVAGGAFAHFNGVPRPDIARLNDDGSLDSTFDPGTGSAGDGVFRFGIVETLAIQPDGKIVAGGDFITYNGVNRRGIARLNANGAVDSSFDPGMGLLGTAFNMAMQPDGKIIVGELFSTPAGVARLRIVRLNPDGRLDGAFSVLEAIGAGANLADDGRILVAGPGAIANGVVQVGFSVVTPDASGPVFTTQPLGATVNAGDSVTFTAAASGAPAPTYQWYKGTSPLAGKTGTTLNLSQVQTADAGSYTVVATNSAGSATSIAAVLTVSSGGTPAGNGGGGAIGPWFVMALWLCAWLRRLRQRHVVREVSDETSFGLAYPRRDAVHQGLAELRSRGTAIIKVEKAGTQWKADVFLFRY